MKKKISIIVPCYNEELALPYFYDTIKKLEGEMKYLNFEYIFINDGSKDKTLDILKKFSKNDKNVKFISFSRNFGKEAAMLAGLQKSSGDYVTIMDADLQDPPHLLKEMYKIIVDEKYDCVGTRRITRKGEPPIRSFFARMFYKIINKISRIEMVDGARDYRLMTRKMVNAILNLKEYNRYSKGIFSFVGFKTKWLEYENVERVAGETKWSFFKLFVYAIEGITAFSTFPLIISIILGIVFCLLSLLLLIIIIFKIIIYNSIISHFTLLICFMFFLSGIQLISIGIVSQYLSKSYLEIKNRPIYIISETEEDI